MDFNELLRKAAEKKRIESKEERRQKQEVRKFNQKVNFNDFYRRKKNERKN